MNNNRKAILPLVLLFIILNTFCITGRSLLEKYNIDNIVLIAANAILFISNFVTLILLQRSLKNSNPNVFVRSMMAGTLIKFMMVAISFMIYAVVAKKNINKPAVYISIFLYFLYLAVEVSLMLKLNKQKNA
jgi:hypothetical protein